MAHFITRSLCCLAIITCTHMVSASEAIAYRLSDWNEMHFDDPAKAAQHLAAVEKLGCEARQDNHNGQTDVVYRLPQWQALEVASDELAHQWEAWLKGAGFETLHGHAADHAEHSQDSHDHSHDGHSHGPQGAEEVAYRLADWTTSRIENPEQLSQYVALMKGLGCEVQVDTQVNVSVRCSQWKHIEVPSHEVASGWENWLHKSGFEARHSHSSRIR